ncbi:phage tail protein [Bartonella rattaustraliani]|uniref:phage tail protein n=1 Tax=Bartonella rattaustraliani TaxID=481139 RepID=UPI0002E0CE24|nr:phage tail protein [Bartonella rattaustraliani]
MSTIYDWSLRASDNARVDTLINWSEGQPPSTVNNSARAMMQRFREYLSDVGGALEGIVAVDHSQQTTLISLQTKSKFSEYKNDILVRFKAKGKNVGTTSVSLNSLPSKSVYKISETGVAVLLEGGEIQTGCIYTLVYDEELSCWHLLNPTPLSRREEMSLYPPGFIGTFAMQAMPSGWLLCDGGAYSRSVYSDLFSAIGTTWGSGDGASTFNIPDLRGVFLRGFDGGRNLDRGRSFATFQEDSIQSHIHGAYQILSQDDDVSSSTHWQGNTTTIFGHALDDDEKSQVSRLIGVAKEDIRTEHSLAMPPLSDLVFRLEEKRSGSPETRPVNVSVSFAIKT